MGLCILPSCGVHPVKHSIPSLGLVWAESSLLPLEVATGRGSSCQGDFRGTYLLQVLPGQRVCCGKCSSGVYSPLGLFSLDSSWEVAGRPPVKSCFSVSCLSTWHSDIFPNIRSKGCYLLSRFSCICRKLAPAFCALGLSYRVTGSLEGYCLVWRLLKSILI